MKNINAINITAPAIAFFLISIAASADKPKALTQNEKLNYAWAAETAIESSENNVELNQNAYIIGIRDANAKRTPLLSETESAVYFDKQILNVRSFKRKEREKEKEKILAIDETLKEMAKKMPSLRTTKNGLMYESLKSGSGKKPKFQDRISITYTVHNTDNQLIANSKTHKPKNLYSVYLLDNGIAEAVQNMEPGATWRLYLTHDRTFHITSSRHEGYKLYDEQKGAVIIDLTLNAVAH